MIFSNIWNAGDKKMTDEEKAYELYCDGHHSCDWGSWSTGIEQYTEALKIKPNYTEVLFWRASAYLFRNDERADYDKAIADFITLLEIDANYKEALSLLAYAHYKNGNNEEAMKQWKKALQTEAKTVLRFMPDEFKDMDICLEAVKKEAASLKYVPKEFKTAEICNEAVKQGGSALEYVPEHLKTAELCMIAVKEWGGALQYVPGIFKTAELCLEAVKQHSSAFNYVPKDLITEELCTIAKEGDKPCCFLFESMPKKFKTYEYCLEAVKHDGWLIKYVPEKFKTIELCFEAFKRNHYALKFTPQSLKSEVQAVIDRWKAGEVV